MEADGAPFIPLPLTVLRFSGIWKATRIRGKSRNRRLSHQGSNREPLAPKAAHLPTGPRLGHDCSTKESRFLKRGENRNTRWKTSQRREPTNSTHIWRRVWKSNPGHIGATRTLSPQCHHCTDGMLCQSTFVGTYIKICTASSHIKFVHDNMETSAVQMKFH